MAAYVFARMAISDQLKFNEYAALARDSVMSFSGTLITGAQTRREILEGESGAAHIAMARFPSFEQALAWYRSPEYTVIRKMRDACASGSVVLVEGLD
jgi:uncharacterized protein (DUF1330 family)